MLTVEELREREPVSEEAYSATRNLIGYVLTECPEARSMFIADLHAEYPALASVLL